MVTAGYDAFGELSAHPGFRKWLVHPIIIAMDTLRFIDIAVLGMVGLVPPLLLRSNRGWRSILAAGGAAWAVMSAWMVVIEYVVDRTGLTAAMTLVFVGVAGLVCLAYSVLWAMALAAIDMISARFDGRAAGS